MATKIELTKDDRDEIEEFEQVSKTWVERFENAKKFNVGDYLVCSIIEFDYDSENERRVLEKGTYNAVLKYKVVHVDGNGFAYVKAVNGKGHTKGDLIPLVGFNDDGDLCNDGYGRVWELDPDYADAIIMQNKESYDPVVHQKAKSAAWREISEHNKDARVATDNLTFLSGFLDRLTCGDKLWTSTKNSLTIVSKRYVPKNQTTNKWWPALQKIKTAGPNVPVLTVTDSKGKTREITAVDYYYKALYSVQPRTYNELKDLNR